MVKQDNSIKNINNRLKWNKRKQWTNRSSNIIQLGDQKNKEKERWKKIQIMKQAYLNYGLSLRKNHQYIVGTPEWKDQERVAECLFK